MINLYPVYGPTIPTFTIGLNIEGTDGVDHLVGTSFDDVMHGYKGDDFLNGGGGNDVIYGDEGNDTIDGGLGNDELHGGIGDDTFIGGPGADKFFGEAGYDTVTYASSTSSVKVDMATGGTTNDAKGDTYSGIQEIVGTAFDDTLTGDANGNTLSGGGGDDTLYGRAGNDTIHGAIGDDILKGGAGEDYLSGGPGSDTLTGDDPGQVYSDTFHLSPNTGPDTITDFQAGVDKIELDGVGAQPFGSDGLLAAGSPYYGPWWYAGVVDAGDKVVYDVGNHTLWQAQVDWDNDEEAYYVTELKEIATFSNGAIPHTGDFIL